MDDFSYHRRLEEEEEAPSQGETWEMVYVGIVLFFMFAALLSDKIGVSAKLDVNQCNVEH